MFQKKSSKGVLFLIVFVDLLGFGIMIPMLPFYARDFGASAAEIGALMFVYSLLQFFLSPGWGRLSDRFGRRPILLLTIFGQGLAFVYAAFSPSYFHLLLSRILAGAFSANISTASAYMADITKPEERAKGMGLIGAAFGIGFVFGPAIGGLLIPYGYEMPSLAAAALCFVNLGLAYLILAEPIAKAERRAQNRIKRSWAFINSTMNQRRFFVPIFLFFLLTLAFTQLEIAFGLFVLDQFKFDERTAGLLLAFVGIVMAIVQGGFIGKLSKAMGEHKLILLGTSLGFMGLVGLVLTESVYSLITALVVMAVGYSLTNPCLSAVTSKAAKSGEQGGVLGVYQSGGSLARILGPLTAGFLYDWDLRYPFLVGAGFLLIAFFVWLSQTKSLMAEANTTESSLAQE